MLLNNDEVRKPYLLRLVFSVLLVLFMVSRTAYLDWDIPPIEISFYIPIDEMYYTVPAFNIYHYGETNPTIVPELKQNIQPVNIMENAVTVIFLNMFGNNYYGLRMASVASSLIIFVLIFLILKSILIGYVKESEVDVDKVRHMKWTFWFLLIYMLCDFSFLLANRVAEPTIFRMLALTIVLYVGSRNFLAGELKSIWYSALMGFLALSAVVFVYIYNAFIYAALAATIFIWAQKAGMKNALKQIAFFVLGSIFCLIIFQIYIHGVYNSNLIEIYKSMTSFQSRMGVGVGTPDKIATYLGNFVFLFLTNIFRYSLILLFAFLMSLPFFIKKVINERNNFEIMVINLVFFLFLQSLVVNDYPLRKLVVVFPLVLIVIAIAYKDLWYYLPHIRPEGIIKTRSFYRIVVVSLTIVMLVSLFYIIKPPSSSFFTGYPMYLNLIAFIIILLILGLLYLGKILNRKTIIAAMILALVPNLCLDLKYIYLNHPRTYKEAMIAMSDKVDGKIIAGGCAYGFRLYNKSIPVLDSYEYEYGPESNREEIYNDKFERSFAENISAYSIAYIADKPGNVVCINYMEEHGLYLEETFNLSGYDIGLFSPRRP